MYDSAFICRWKFVGKTTRKNKRNTKGINNESYYKIGPIYLRRAYNISEYFRVDCVLFNMGHIHFNFHILCKLHMLWNCRNATAKIKQNIKCFIYITTRTTRIFSLRLNTINVLMSYITIYKTTENKLAKSCCVVLWKHKSENYCLIYLLLLWYYIRVKLFGYSKGKSG